MDSLLSEAEFIANMLTESKIKELVPHNFRNKCAQLIVSQLILLSEENEQLRAKINSRKLKQQKNDVSTNTTSDSAITYYNFVKSKEFHTIVKLYESTFSSVQLKRASIRIPFYTSELGQMFSSQFFNSNQRLANAWLESMIIRVIVKSLGHNFLVDNTDVDYLVYSDYARLVSSRYASDAPVHANSWIISTVDKILESILALNDGSAWLKWYTSNTRRVDLKTILESIVHNTQQIEPIIQQQQHVQDTIPNVTRLDYTLRTLIMWLLETKNEFAELRIPVFDKIDASNIDEDSNLNEMHRKLLNSLTDQFNRDNIDLYKRELHVLYSMFLS